MGLGEDVESMLLAAQCSGCLVLIAFDAATDGDGRVEFGLTVSGNGKHGHHLVPF